MIDPRIVDSTAAQHHAEKQWFGRLDLEVLPMPTGQGAFIKP